MAVSGDAVIQEAMRWLGTPYVWGGTGPNPGQGVDCSGFVQRVYAVLGISLPRTTYEQINVGQAIPSLAQAAAGDLLFYNRTGHVAIYMGGNQQIAAPNTGKNVEIETVGQPEAIRRVADIPGSTVAAQPGTLGAGTVSDDLAAGGFTVLGLGVGAVLIVALLGGAMFVFYKSRPGGRS